MRIILSQLITFILIFILNIDNLYSAKNHTHLFKELSMTEGLSDLTVRCIFKDSYGFVWLGTDSSLDRFDGVNIISYKFDFTRKNIPIYAITEDQSNKIWVATSNGLFYVNHENYLLEPFATDLIHFKVNCLHEFNGKLYIGTAKGLFIYENESTSLKLLENNILNAANCINDIKSDINGNLWFATNGGLYCLKSAESDIKIVDNKRNLSQFNFISILNNNIYLGTSGNGIFIYDILKNEFEVIKEFNGAFITSLSNNGDDIINISTDGKGIYFYSDNKKRVIESFHHKINEKSVIRSNSVYSLYIDKDGITWIAYYQGGIDYSLNQKSFFKTYNYENCFNSYGFAVRTFSEHGIHQIIGTREGLFYINTEKRKCLTFSSQELNSNLILSSVWSDGYFYIGTFGGGLWRFNPINEKLERFNLGNENSEKERIFCISKDLKNNVWIGTSTGLYKIKTDDNEIVHYNNHNSQITEGNIYEIFFDSNNKGWICSEYGMCIYDEASSSIKSNIFPSGFINNEKIRNIYEDAENKLFFLPEKGDIFVSDLNMTNYYTLKLKDVEYGNSFMSIINDKEGNYWISADGGLLCHNPKTNETYPYGFQDGLPSLQFTNRSAYIDNNGLIRMGNAKGLVCFNPSEIDFSLRYPYKIQITSVTVNGEKDLFNYESNKNAYNKIVASGNKNNIKFEFTPLTYASQNNIFFEYKLEGYEKEWNKKMGVNEIYYYNLPLGKYNFKIRIPGIENSESSQEVNIILATSTWIITIIIGVIILLLMILFFLRYKRKENSVNHSEIKTDYNDEEILNDLPEKSIDNKTHSEKYKTNRLSQSDCELLSDKLYSFMNRSDIYKNPELKIADLANELETNSHSLSFLFNQHLNISYSDFINEYRINLFKQIVKESDLNKFTIAALAEQCGFNSRASFFRAFKKTTGLTPKEYIQKYVDEE